MTVPASQPQLDDPDERPADDAEEETPPEPAPPTHVLTLAAVRWGIDQLKSQKLHSYYPAYLHLYRQNKGKPGVVTNTAWSELSVVLRMDGGPKPHYRPFWETNNREASYWLNKNIRGSYQANSIRTDADHSFLRKGLDSYLPADHVAMALTVLSFDVRVPALAAAAFLLREFGFAFEENHSPGAADLLSAFKDYYTFSASGNAGDFEKLFDSSEPDVDFDWFQPVEEAPRG
jgi:hypothetical protein